MRHNKKRNTALLYEFLIRHITKCLVESKTAEATKAVSLLKKYFKDGPLKEELSLFNQVIHGQVQTTQYADKILNEVQKQAKRMDAKKLDKTKGLLIKEINMFFDRESFYNHKIPNYVVFASLQSLFNDGSGQKKINEAIDKLRIQERLVSFMITERDKTKEALKVNPQYNNAVYRMVLKKFDKKYSEVLNESQKSLLNKYAASLVTENSNIFLKAMSDEIDKAKEKLAIIHNNEVAKDKDLVKKITECRARLSKIDKTNSSKENVINVLRFMSLADEVNT